MDTAILENTKIKIDTDLGTIKRLLERYKSDPSAVQKLREDPVKALAEFGITLDQSTATAIKGALRSAPPKSGGLHVSVS
jgi:hypothetical protein